jgi:hypothetical protein
VSARAAAITGTRRPRAVVMLLRSPTTFIWKRSEEIPVISASAFAVPKASSTAARPVSNTPLRARMWIRIGNYDIKIGNLADTAKVAASLCCAAQSTAT